MWSIGASLLAWKPRKRLFRGFYGERNPLWLDVLRHARHGMCKEEHLQILRSLIIENKGSSSNAISDPAWEDAVLVTPRHAVRIAWNERASRKHCARHKKQLFICPAEDTIHGRSLTIEERWSAACKIASRTGKKTQRRKGGLPDLVEVAVGMEVMVTVNVETELDVTNGARGVVHEVILDRRETNDASQAETRLRYPPECILVKLHRTKAKKLDGLNKAGQINVWSEGSCRSRPHMRSPTIDHKANPFDE